MCVRPWTGAWEFYLQLYIFKKRDPPPSHIHQLPMVPQKWMKSGDFAPHLYQNLLGFIFFKYPHLFWVERSRDVMSRHWFQNSPSFSSSYTFSLLLSQCSLDLVWRKWVWINSFNQSRYTLNLEKLCSSLSLWDNQPAPKSWYWDFWLLRNDRPYLRLISWLLL